MDLKEMGQYLLQPEPRSLLRVESLANYRSDADTAQLERWREGLPPLVDAGWRAWLDALRKRADSGNPWSRLHVLTEPLSEHLLFELGVQYVANAAAGEIIRILVMDRPERAGDFFVINDGEKVAVSNYDEDGRFDHAQIPANPDHYVALARQMWSDADPFEEWWAARPHYHGQRRAA
jgi:hypothetical protein